MNDNSPYNGDRFRFGDDGELLLRGVIEEIDHVGQIKSAAVFFEDTRSGGEYGINLYVPFDDQPIDPLEDYIPGSVPVNAVGPLVILSILALETPALKGIAQRIDII